MTDFIEAVRKRVADLNLDPQRGLTAQELEFLTNWHWPEPEVPQGWADWFAHGKELH